MEEHLSQTDLIQYLDGELIEPTASCVQSHLDRCNRCQIALIESRLLVEELEQIRFLDKSEATVESGRDEAQALLRAKLSEASKASTEIFPGNRALSIWQRVPASFYRAGLAATGIALVFLLAPNLYRSVAEISISLPNRALTPGMTKPISIDRMCSTGDDDNFDPAVSDSVRQTIFGEYGILPDRSRNDFQVDYLISPQLGGTNDVRNLWPQSYKATTWNAAAKDRLERHLHQLVCEKKIDLADAQHDIATNWIAAYQKYFRTRRPI